MAEITPVLYGGGRKWRLETIVQNEYGFKSNPLKYIVLAHQKLVEVDLFALSTSFIIWLNDYAKGIELEYSCIGAHSIRKNTSGTLELSLKVRNNGIFYNNDDFGGFKPEFIEFICTPLFGESDRYYNDEVENLFTYENFGMNKGDKMVINTFNAIGKCAAFHLYDDDMEYSGDIQLGSHINAFAEGYVNDGNADDMDHNEGMMDEEEYGAGIYMNIAGDVKRGVVRGRDDHSEMGNCKRVRC
jgi:hypothetical protein